MCDVEATADAQCRMSGFPHIYEDHKSADNSPSSSSTFSTTEVRRRVPFSWELEPGVPKNQSTTFRTRSFSWSDQEDYYHHRHPDDQLPPPPKFGKGAPRKVERKRGRIKGNDPFEVAMQKVTKEKNTCNKSKRWTSIFTIMGSCSSSKNQVSLPHPKLIPREPSKGVRPNQVLDDHRLKQFGSDRVLGGSWG